MSYRMLSPSRHFSWIQFCWPAELRLIVCVFSTRGQDAEAAPARTNRLRLSWPQSGADVFSMQLPNLSPTTSTTTTDPPLPKTQTRPWPWVQKKKKKWPQHNRPGWFLLFSILFPHLLSTLFSSSRRKPHKLETNTSTRVVAGCYITHFRPFFSGTGSVWRICSRKWNSEYTTFSLISIVLMVCVCPWEWNVSPLATAAALNPATPPLSTITWIWTQQQWMWKKKFGGLAGITFLQLVSHSFEYFFPL